MNTVGERLEWIEVLLKNSSWNGNYRRFQFKHNTLLINSKRIGIYELDKKGENIILLIMDKVYTVEVVSSSIIHLKDDSTIIELIHEDAI